MNFCFLLVLLVFHLFVSRFRVVLNDSIKNVIGIYNQIQIQSNSLQFNYCCCIIYSVCAYLSIFVFVLHFPSFFYCLFEQFGQQKTVDCSFGAKAKKDLSMKSGEYVDKKRYFQMDRFKFCCQQQLL